MDTVPAYHGTSLANARRILDVGFCPSRNAYDWLGEGSYFFERSPARTLAWALESHPSEPAAVLRAIIDLDDGCLDLTDEPGCALLRPHYDALVALYGVAAASRLRQTPSAPRFDCAVINFAVARLAHDGVVVRSVRCAFREGAPLWTDQSGVLPKSIFYDKTHIQVCVRDPRVIQELELVES